jgi:hypothetical protein
MKKILIVLILLLHSIANAANVQVVDKNGHKLDPKADGSIDVNVQDQHTEPIDSLFAQSVSNFTLSSATGESGITAATFVYTFEATAGHGITDADPNTEILLLDVAADKSFYATVTGVSTNTITVDRPIDHIFPTTTLGRIVNTNMAVDGSTTPQIFTLRAGSVPIDITGFTLDMLDDTAMDNSTFGSRAALANGLAFRIVDSFHKTIFNFKTNGEMAKFWGPLDYAPKVGGGDHGVTGTVRYGGQGNHGIVLRVSGDDVLQWVVQDDLTSQNSITVTAQGHLTEGEN